MTTHRILALDPGTVNFGFALIEIKGKKTFRVLRCGMLKHRIKELKGEVLKNDSALFKKEIKWLLRKAKPTHIVAERYVPRRQGLANESVNMMLGHIGCSISNTDIKYNVWLAATWKAKLKKAFDPKDDDGLEEFYPRFNVADHQVDAAMIGFYQASLSYGFDLLQFKAKIVRNRLIKQIDKMSRDPKPPKKIKKAPPKAKPRAKAKVVKRAAPKRVQKRKVKK